VGEERGVSQLPRLDPDGVGKMVSASWSSPCLSICVCVCVFVLVESVLFEVIKMDMQKASRCFPLAQLIACIGLWRWSWSWLGLLSHLCGGGGRPRHCPDRKKAKPRGNDAHTNPPSLNYPGRSLTLFAVLKRLHPSLGQQTWFY
jgi:hypothetical protein